MLIISVNINQFVAILFVRKWQIVGKVWIGKYDDTIYEQEDRIEGLVGKNMNRRLGFKDDQD